MCVIMAAQSERIPENVLVQAFETNRDGAGIAWRENGKVRFHKGITEVETLLALSAEVPLPYVAHCRIATCGGTGLGLTHPFPVQRDVPLILEGSAPAVIFHNGHWNDWRREMMGVVRQGKLPIGRWTDSRAIAYFAALYGPGVLDIIDEKVLYFSNDHFVAVAGKWDVEDGVWYSNTLWKWKGCRTTTYDRERLPSHYTRDSGGVTNLYPFPVLDQMSWERVEALRARGVLSKQEFKRYERYRNEWELAGKARLVSPDPVAESSPKVTETTAQTDSSRETRKEQEREGISKLVAL